MSLFFSQCVCCAWVSVCVGCLHYQAINSLLLLFKPIWHHDLSQAFFAWGDSRGRTDTAPTVRGEFQRGVLTHTKWMGQWYSRSKEEGTLGHYAERPTVQGGVTYRGGMQRDSNKVDWPGWPTEEVCRAGIPTRWTDTRGNMQMDSIN